MRKGAALLVLTLITVIILAAVGCGGGEEATPTPAATTTPTPAATVAPTAPPTATPTVAPPTATQPPQTAPQMTQCRFYGSVKLNGSSVPDGTIITIIVAGDEYTTTTPATGYPTSHYAQMVVPPSGTFYTGGTAVTFKVGGYTAAQTASWEQGGNIRTDLTASSS